METKEQMDYDKVNCLHSKSSIFPECGVKNKVLITLSLGGVSLLALFISLCGIGLSMGFRKLSIVSFFSAIGLLVLLNLARRFLAQENVRKPEP